MLLKSMFGHAKPGSASLRYQTTRSGGVGVVKPYGLIMGIPSDITNRYTPGAGVGSTSIFARRAKLRNSWSNCPSNLDLISKHFVDTTIPVSLTIPDVVHSSINIIPVSKPLPNLQNNTQSNNSQKITHQTPNNLQNILQPTFNSSILNKII
jgi:hypothetical protein